MLYHIHSLWVQTRWTEPHYRGVDGVGGRVMVGEEVTVLYLAGRETERGDYWAPRADVCNCDLPHTLIIEWLLSDVRSHRCAYVPM